MSGGYPGTIPDDRELGIILVKCVLVICGPILLGALLYWVLNMR